jgi:acyl-CoA hydrolase
MEVRVDSYVEELDGERELINRAYSVFVALDENEQPAEVPRLILETQQEKDEWEAAQKRRELREQRAQSGI